MGVLISPIVLTRLDQLGNPYVDVYSIFEYRDNLLNPAGEAISLDPYLRRVEYIEITPISGATNFRPFIVAGDYPGNAGSGRASLTYLGSALVTLNISGAGITITSGQIFTVSGVLGLLSALVRLTGSGAINAGVDLTQVLSGTGVSGTRGYIHAFGY